MKVSLPCGHLHWPGWPSTKITTEEQSMWNSSINKRLRLALYGDKLRKYGILGTLLALFLVKVLQHAKIQFASEHWIF